MLWECRLKHQWKATHASVKQKTWCPECGGSKRKTIEYCMLIAKDRGGECLSVEYTNCTKNMRWRCIRMHEWEATLNNISAGQWCPRCDDLGKRCTIDDCILAAEGNGGECVTTEYEGCEVNMVWRCAAYHEWPATYNNVRRGKWCPKCKTNTAENKLAKIIERVFDMAPLTRYKGLEWLRSKRKLEIDIYLYELKIAIEYDGDQHFKPMRYGSKK
jgi:hypothetical protein